MRVKMTRTMRIPVAGLSHLRRRLLLGRRPLSTTPNDPTSTIPSAAAAAAREEAYRQVHNLDFPTAAKILFGSPPKRKTFGFGFHLVQFISVCIPPLAVYLVAQYARYEIRRMEAEVELKKKQAEEEEKVKATESEPIEEGSDPQLSKVIVRLDALEDAVKELADKRKGASPSSVARGEGARNKEQASPADNDSSPRNKSGAGEVRHDNNKMVGGVNPTGFPKADQNQKDEKVDSG